MYYKVKQETFELMLSLIKRHYPKYAKALEEVDIDPDFIVCLKPWKGPKPMDKINEKDSD